jgi:flagellin
MRINNNLAAANASRNLGETQSNISKNVEKLSTGFRINRAGDDASGLVISNSLRAQTSGLRQAIRNGQDGVSVLQTAEGALDQVNTMLNRMRDLAVQAANTGTNSLAARTAAQAEVTALGEEVTRISNTTKFGSLNLLDGSFGVTTAKSSGFVSNASSIVVAGANTQLAITFNAGSATTGIVTGTVTASLVAATYTSADAYASEVTRAVKAALLGATTANVRALADSVEVTAQAVTGGGAAMTLDIGGLATGQTFATAGGATTAGAATGWTAMTTAAVSGSGGNFQVGANAGEGITLNIASTSMATLGLSTISLTGTDAAI